MIIRWDIVKALLTFLCFREDKHEAKGKSININEINYVTKVATMIEFLLDAFHDQWCY